VKKALMEVFPNDLHVSSLVPYTSYLQLNESIFSEIPNYRKWLDHEKSSLLFISGSTAYEGRKLKGRTHCWLSPAAIYMTESLTRQGCNVVFFSCHPDIESISLTGEAVLSSLISLVLQWRPEILRDKDSEFRQILDGVHHPTREHKLVDLLGAVLLEMKDLGTVYFVLDRLDCCKTRIDNLTNELARLITVMNSPEFRVKVAIVVETSGGTGNWRSDFLPEYEYATDRLFIVQHWDQRRLTSSETSLGRRPSIWSSSSAQTV
jgi:hypothetical protein